jgi:hypothetical protein
MIVWDINNKEIVTANMNKNSLINDVAFLTSVEKG